ncbi:MAG: hypothetical protein IKF00_07340 [Solobacterium sp.]|nr:hypothetical protein [Erysipelotrichaceae bacterium]MBR2844999.1 hypothetical protein [Solobacterium sp.]
MSTKQYRSLSDHQCWFIARRGIMSELRGDEAMDYLKKTMDLMDKTYRYSRFLYQSIKYELKKYKSSDNIINDVLELDEVLSCIEVYCSMFLEQYGHMSDDIESLKREYLEPPY